MFDILMFLFESYFYAGSYPDSDKLSLKLSAAGFEDEDIHQALTWLSGLKQLTQADYPATINNSGERYYEAEMHRLKGELTLQKFRVSGSQFQVQNSPESEAEECFLKAIGIAREQQAKSLELRAVMSLSQLWQSHGKKEEAHRMLAEIYGWFTDGFSSVDLKEARALLEELGNWVIGSLGH